MSTDDRLTSALYAQEQRDKFDKNGDAIADHAADLRDVPAVWRELQHAQEQAARVKPLREELDRLLGRKSRTRKAAP